MTSRKKTQRQLRKVSSPSFMEVQRLSSYRAKLCAIAVDEAHVIKQW